MEVGLTSVITFPVLKLSLPKLETSMRQTRSHRLKVCLLHKMRKEEGVESFKKALSTTMGRKRRRNRERRDVQEEAERRMRKKTLMK